MNRSIYVLIASLLAILILSTCAQRGGHNPVGATGGSDGGYGYSKDYYRESANLQENDNIFGIWNSDNSTVTLNADGTFEFKSNQEISIGTFSKSKDTITLNNEDGTTKEFKYDLDRDHLLLKPSE